MDEVLNDARRMAINQLWLALQFLSTHGLTDANRDLLLDYYAKAKVQKAEQAMRIIELALNLPEANESDVVVRIAQ